MASLKSVNYNESVTVSVLSRDELYIGRYVQSFGNTTFIYKIVAISFSLIKTRGFIRGLRRVYMKGIAVMGYHQSWFFRFA